MKNQFKLLDNLFLKGQLTQSFRNWRKKNLQRRSQSIGLKFHRLFYQLQAYEDQWMGIPSVQNPLDMWIKQRIIWETKPEIIIETGTYHGGTALFYANLLEAIGHGKVITIDTDPKIEQASKHPLFMKRVISLKGSSVQPEIVQEVAKTVGYANAMLILDSNHAKDHVLKELKIYSPLVAPGNYIIVDDTQLNGHPVLKSFGPGPYEAVQEFIRTNPDFEIDPAREKFLFTFNPSGYLRKKSIA